MNIRRPLGPSGGWLLHTQNSIFLFDIIYIPLITQQTKKGHFKNSDWLGFKLGFLPPSSL